MWLHDALIPRYRNAYQDLFMYCRIIAIALQALDNKKGCNLLEIYLRIIEYSLRGMLVSLIYTLGAKLPAELPIYFEVYIIIIIIIIVK